MRALYLDARHRSDAQAAAQAVGSATHGQGAMAELLQDMAHAGYTPVVPDADALPAAVEWDRIAHDLDAPEHGSETPCETVYLWPENKPVLACWQLVQGQWRMGFNGPATFDAAGAYALLQEVQPSRYRRAQWWPLLLSCADEMAVQRGIDAERAQAEHQLQQAMRH